MKTNDLATYLIIKAAQNGYVELAPGLYLNEKENLIAEQKDWDEYDLAKKMDFSTAPFWVTSVGEGTPEPMYDIENVINCLTHCDICANDPLIEILA